MDGISHHTWKLLNNYWFSSGKKRKFSEMMEYDSLLGFFEETISGEGSPPTNAEKELFECSRYRISHILSYSSILRQIYSKVIHRCVSKATKITWKVIIIMFSCHDMNCYDKITKSVEKETWSQYKWFMLRAGRLTDSCMKQVCYTDFTNPA